MIAPTFSVVEITERATRVLLTGCTEAEARDLADRLGKADRSSRFGSRPDGASK